MLRAFTLNLPMEKHGSIEGWRFQSVLSLDETHFTLLSPASLSLTAGSCVPTDCQRKDTESTELWINNEAQLSLPSGELLIH